METWRADEFAAAGLSAAFVQDNQSASRQGVLRGLHFQRQNTQAKLVRVIKGRVYDVAVDLRPGSPGFGRWTGAELNDENRLQFYVPEGFAHGFLVLSPTAEFVYKCSDVYNHDAEGGVRWNDPDIGVVWPEVDGAPVLSDKDKALPPLSGQDFTCFEGWLVR
jgi:dTDP-4-dehydrorhamnose 3,5-epimerase